MTIRSVGLFFYRILLLLFFTVAALFLACLLGIIAHAFAMAFAAGWEFIP